MKYFYQTSFTELHICSVVDFYYPNFVTILLTNPILKVFQVMPIQLPHLLGLENPLSEDRNV